MPAIALSGRELLDIIEAQMKRELIQHPDFAVHLTHPRCQYEVTVKLSSLLSEPSERSHVVTGEAVAKQPPGEAAPAPLPVDPAKLKKTTIKFGSDLLTRPDQARDEAGLAKPAQQVIQGPQGEMTDMADYKPGQVPWEQATKP